jgi:hypothetical protein
MNRTSTIKALSAAGFKAKLDVWGGISAETENGVRVIVNTSGERRCHKKIHHVSVFSTVRTPSSLRLTEGFRIAKTIRDVLKMPVTFSAAGRMVAKVLA